MLVKGLPLSSTVTEKFTHIQMWLMAQLSIIYSQVIIRDVITGTQ